MRYFLLQLLIIISSCSPTTSPSKQWKIAHHGLYHASFSKDQQFMLVASYIHGASLWKNQEFERLFNWNHIDGLFTPLLHTQFSGDASIALTADNREFVVWDTNTGKSIAYWLAPADIIDIALDQHGNFALLGLKNNRALVFNIKTGGIIAQFSHTQQINTVGLSQQGRLAISGGFDNKLSIWQVDTQQLIHTIPLENYARIVDINDELGLLFVQPARSKGQIIDLKSGKIQHTLNIANEHITFSHILDHQRIILGNNKNQLLLYNFQKNKQLQRWQLKHSSQRANSDYILSAVQVDNHFIAISTDGFAYLLK